MCFEIVIHFYRYKGIQTQNTCTHKIIKLSKTRYKEVEIVISSYVIKSSLKQLHMLIIISDYFIFHFCVLKFLLVCDDFIYFL